MLVSIDRKYLGKPIEIELLVRDEVSKAEKTLHVGFMAPFGYGPKEEHHHEEHGEGHK